MSDMTAQQWNAADYASHARFVSDLGQPVFDLLQPKAGERILDLGCGDGALTEQLASQGSIVVGIDTSADLLAAARARGLDVRLIDAQALSFVGEFDAVFSNAVLHWIPDLRPVLDGVYRALRSGGRFVGEFGGHGCVAAVCTALRAVAARHGVEIALPWNFATVEEFEASLAAAGFEPLFVRLGAKTHVPAIGNSPMVANVCQLGLRCSARGAARRGVRRDRGTAAPSPL